MMNIRALFFCAIMALTGYAVAQDMSTIDFESAAPQQDSNLESIKGEIVEIAEDGSYIVVNDGTTQKKVITSMEIVAEAYFEVGDKVGLSVEKSADGLKLVGYEFIFEEEQESSL